MLAQVSFVLSQSTRLADGQTDGRADRRTKRPWQYRALHYMQSRGKKDDLICNWYAQQAT